MEREMLEWLHCQLDTTIEDAKEAMEYLSENWTVLSVTDMAAHLKLPSTKVRNIARKLELGPRPERESLRDPTRLEIMYRAGEIRKTWTPAEKVRRDLRRRSPRAEPIWEAPTVTTGVIESPTFARNPLR